MIRALIIAASILAAGAAVAQPSAPPPPPAGAEPPPIRRPGPPSGAFIRIERPDLSITVRCGEGESSKACSETVSQLVEKLAATPSNGGPPMERRFDRREREGGGGYRGERDDRRYRDRE